MLGVSQLHGFNAIRDVLNGPGSFVAISDGSSMSSPDGETWTEHAVVAGGGWQAIAWDSITKQYAAVGNGASKIMTSPDGETWTAQTVPASTALWQSIAPLPYSGGGFVACGRLGTANDSVMTSSDGITWTLTPCASSLNLTVINLPGGSHYAFNLLFGTEVNGFTSNPTGAYTSAASALDGSPSALLIVETGLTQVLASLVFCPEENYVIGVSSDGAVWHPGQGGLANSSHGVAVGWGWGKTTPAWGGDPSVTPLADVLAFGYFDTVPAGALSSVTYASHVRRAIAVALSGTGRVATLEFGGGTPIDSTTPWTSRTAAAAVAWKSVCYSPYLKLACAVSNTAFATAAIMTSPEGIDWTAHTAPAVGWISICWGTPR